MHNTPIVLFVNHLQPACGVYQIFKRMIAPVIQLSDTYHYIETNQEWEHDHWRDIVNPDIVVYNFYFSGATMPWLTDSKIASQKSRFKQLSLHHEGSIENKGFDLILHQNPLNEDTRYHNLPRHIPEYTAIDISNEVPTIGTFGFGLGGKGFGTLVDTAAREFDKAHIRMNIPFAYFGDANGDGARGWANHCRSLLAAHNKPDIQLTITHELLPEEQLLYFLAGNDINAFMYDDNIGRGISSTLDYALAVYKPIAITKSDQFRHMWDERIIVAGDNGLKEIIAAGIQPLQQYHDKWNNKAVIDAYNTAFSRVLGKETQ
jgi:hypothetical protein